MKQDLVSVIMSEYNTDVALLKDSIKSIVDQTYKNLEIIIIDDCGFNSKGLESLISSFNDSRIKLYKNKTNRGLVYSLNKAIKLSNGEYIARMDTDDYSYPNRIEEEMKFLKNNPQYDLVGSRCDYYDGQNVWGENNNFGEITRNKILNGCPLNHPSVIYKKAAILSVGGYSNFKRCEDYATWIAMFINNSKMFILDKKLIRYHLSVDDYKKRTLKNRKAFLKLIRTDYKKLNPSIFDIFKIEIKTIIAGVVPGDIMFLYHKRKFK